MPEATSADVARSSLLDELPVRHAIGGLEGFRSRSSIRFVARTIDPHEFVATYVFPARALWRLQRKDARPSERRLVFFCGERVFSIADREGSSTELEPGPRELERLRAELRRVAMTWPAGLEWTERDGELHAELGELGVLEARARDARGRPSELAALSPDGGELERLEAIAWSEAGRWPVGWTLVSESEPIWEETILEVTTGLSYLDRYFLPPDRLVGAAVPPWDAGAVQAISLSRRPGRRVPLEADRSWPAARQHAEEALREEQVRIGGSPIVDHEPAVEVDPAGNPTAIWLRLAGEVEHLPEGWVWLPGGGGRALWLDTPERVDGALLARIAAGFPAGSIAGPPFVWLRAAGDGEDGQLVVPVQGD